MLARVARRDHPVVPLRPGHRRRQPDLLVRRLLVDHIAALRRVYDGQDARLDFGSFP